jgi:hypothetical protein
LCVYLAHRDKAQEKRGVRAREIQTGAEGHMSERGTYTTIDERYFERDPEADNIAADYLSHNIFAVTVFPGVVTFVLFLYFVW